MTKYEWETTTDIWAMLAAVNLSARKKRLFAVACCRHLWYELNEKSKKAIRMAELYADGKITLEELSTAYVEADESINFMQNYHVGCAVASTLDNNYDYHKTCAYHIAVASNKYHLSCSWQCRLLRHFVGDIDKIPFAP